MMRHWIIADDPEFSRRTTEDEEVDLHVRHVLPGHLGSTGEPITHGHIVSVKCDCKPRIEETLDILIVIHRHDA